MENLGWKDIAEYVESVVSKESARPNPSHYRMLANQALNIISTETKCFRNAWANIEGGGLTVNGRYIIMPTDCIEVESVVVNNEVLMRTHDVTLNDSIGDWHNINGRPDSYTLDSRHIILNADPTTIPAGQLIVYGVGLLPHFIDGGDTNPLVHLPVSMQLAPAYYILSRLPAKAQPFRDGGRMIGVDTSEVDRKADYTELWKQELNSIKIGIRQRRDEIFTY